MSEMRLQLRRVIFGYETTAGQVFDIGLLIAILASVAVVLLESVQTIYAIWGSVFFAAELFFTGLFTLEYLLRLYSAERPARYVRSFWGVVDLLAILPTYISFFVPGAQSLLVIRALRLLRVFHIFHLRRYLVEETLLMRAFKASLPKIVVFLVVLINVIVIVGALMFLVEGPSAGFTSVPRGIYWAVVTISTVGFGDITPLTALGQAIAGLLMMLGYCLIVVPTALVSVELAQGLSRESKLHRCSDCGQLEHPAAASFCHRCSHPLATPSLKKPFGPT